MKLNSIALPLAGLLATAGIAAGVTTTLAATNASEHSPCRPDGVEEDRFGYNAGDPISNELPTIYTDGGNHYVGVCGGGEGQPVRYIQVNDLDNASKGGAPVVEGQTGVEEVDSVVWAYGPATFWLTGSGTESPNPGCAPEGDTKLGHANGNNVTRELPTVYTDNLEHHVGVCGGGGRVQVNELAGSPENLVTIEGAPAPEDIIPGGDVPAPARP
jgi:hypothetical protein